MHILSPLLGALAGVPNIVAVSTSYAVCSHVLVGSAGHLGFRCTTLRLAACVPHAKVRCDPKRAAGLFNLSQGPRASKELLA